MINTQYISDLKEIIRQYFSQKEYRVFVFGSAVTQSEFRDVDVGIIGAINSQDLYRLEKAASTLFELIKSEYPDSNY